MISVENTRNLIFETKFAQIRCKLTEIHQSENWQVDFNLQNFGDFQGIDSHNACTPNNMPL